MHRRAPLLAWLSGALLTASSTLVACTVPGPPPDYTGAGSAPKVAILGDDTIATADSALHNALDPTYRSSVVGMTGATVSQLQGTATYFAGSVPDHVIIDLGAQDLRAGADRAAALGQLEQMVEVFPASTCVHVTGLDTGNPQAGYGIQAVLFNSGIAAMASSHPNMRVIVWPQVEAIDTAMGSPAGPLMDGWGFSTEGARQFAVSAKASIDGCHAPAQITTLVYDDINGDGVREPGETGVDGVVVRLVPDWLTLPGYETINDHAVTTNGGRVENNGLLPGDYVAMPEDPYLPTFTGVTQQRVTVTPGTNHQLELGYHDTGPRVAILGDSITYLARDVIRVPLEPTHQVSIWARSMQLLRDTQSVADAYAADPPATVIINLGTNDVGSGRETIDGDLRRMVETFPTVPCVFVTTITEMSPDFAANAVTFNNNIRQLPSRYPNVRVIDWSQTLHDHELDPHGEGPLLDAGNIHPTSLGQEYLANAYSTAAASCP